MGDFSSIVGEGSTDNVVGPFGLSRRIERGKMLIDFCKQHEVVMNTWFKKRKTKLYTWRSPGDKNRYQVDYILVKQRFRNSIRDVKTFPGADIDSDHTLLVAEVQTRLKAFKKAEKRKPKWNLEVNKSKIQSNRWNNRQR